MSAGASAQPGLPRRQQALIVGLLLILAALAWIFLIATPMGTPSGDMGVEPLGMAPMLFLAVWIVMMVAMMFPTAAPMITAFARVSATNQRRGQAFVPTWVFVGGYLVVWGVAGLVAYLASLGFGALAREWMWLQDDAARLGGVVLILAGLYQLSPLKRTCLSKCRSPLAFILTSWRGGYVGALRMGAEHGAYCLGCCWMLFAVLFPLGLMNVAAMALVTVLIFTEKSLPLGLRIAQAAAVCLVAYGALVVLIPSLLPTSM